MRRWPEPEWQPTVWSLNVARESYRSSLTVSQGIANGSDCHTLSVCGFTGTIVLQHCVIYIVNIDTGRATSLLPEAPDMAERCLGVTGCRSATEDDVSLRHCWVVWVLFDWVLPGPKVPDLKSLCS